MSPVFMSNGFWPNPSKREGSELGREWGSVYTTSKQADPTTSLIKQLVSSVKQCSS